VDVEDAESNDYPPPWEDNILRRMVELRSAKMSQTELARQLQERGLPFHQQTVQRIESGQRPVRLNEAFTIAEVLGSNLGDMARTITASERALDRAVGDLQHTSGQMAEQGLRWKRAWDGDRRHLRSAIARADNQLEDRHDVGLARDLDQAHKLIKAADELDGLLVSVYQKLAKIVTGQDNSLKSITEYDRETGEAFQSTAVPWTGHSIREYPHLIELTDHKHSDDGAANSDK